MPISHPGWLAFLLAVGATAQTPDERIEVGRLGLDVYISRTAALFHVVDQLSEWSYYSHRQYGRAFAPLSDADRAVLEQHGSTRTTGRVFRRPPTEPLQGFRMASGDVP